MPKTPYPNRRTRSGARATGVMINTLEGVTDDSATTSTGPNPINPQTSNNQSIGYGVRQLNHLQNTAPFQNFVQRPIFDNRNEHFQAWQDQMEAHLSDVGYLHILNNPNPSDEDNKQLYFEILRCLSFKTSRIITSKAKYDGKKAYLKLEEHFMGDKVAQKKAALAEFYQLKMGINENIQQFLIKTDVMMKKLETLNVFTDPSTPLQNIIAALPDTYKYLKITLTGDDNIHTYNQLRSKITSQVCRNVTSINTSTSNSHAKPIMHVDTSQSSSSSNSNYNGHLINLNQYGSSNYRGKHRGRGKYLQHRGSSSNNDRRPHPYRQQNNSNGQNTNPKCLQCDRVGHKSEHCRAPYYCYKCLKRGHHTKYCNKGSTSHYGTGANQVQVQQGNNKRYGNRGPRQQQVSANHIEVQHNLIESDNDHQNDYLSQQDDHFNNTSHSDTNQYA